MYRIRAVSPIRDNTDAIVGTHYSALPNVYQTEALARKLAARFTDECGAEPFFEVVEAVTGEVVRGYGPVAIDDEIPF